MNKLTKETILKVCILILLSSSQCMVDINLINSQKKEKYIGSLFMTWSSYLALDQTVQLLD